MNNREWEACSARSWISSYIWRVPLLQRRVMKARTDNNLRIAEVSLSNGENGVQGAFQWAASVGYVAANRQPCWQRSKIIIIIVPATASALIVHLHLQRWYQFRTISPGVYFTLARSVDTVLLFRVNGVKNRNWIAFCDTKFWKPIFK